MKNVKYESPKAVIYSLNVANIITTSPVIDPKKPVVDPAIPPYITEEDTDPE